MGAHNLPPSVIPASKHFLRRQDGQFFLLSLSMVQSFLLAQRYFCFPRKRKTFFQKFYFLSQLAAKVKLQKEQSWMYRIYTKMKVKKWSESDIWPSMVTHTRNLCSAFNPSKVHTHTHREHTPGAVGSHLCCSARGAVGGSVPCSRAPQSWYWRRREHCTFTPPTYNSCRPETRTRNLWITSPTL